MFPQVNALIVGAVASLLSAKDSDKGCYTGGSSVQSTTPILSNARIAGAVVCLPSAVSSQTRLSTFKPRSPSRLRFAVRRVGVVRQRPIFSNNLRYSRCAVLRRRPTRAPCLPVAPRYPVRLSKRLNSQSGRRAHLRRSSRRLI